MTPPRYVCWFCKQPITQARRFDRRVYLGNTEGGSTIETDCIDICCGYSWAMFLNSKTITMGISAKPISVELDVHGRPVPIPNFFMFLYRRFMRYAMRYM